MKLLLGGIPLGCDNIGDEAILECVVKLLEELSPDCEISVCTADHSTSERLKVNVVPLFGFDQAFTLDGFREEVRRHDCFIWAGATGLSDYPQVAIRLLRVCRQEKVPAIVWNVGMNSNLNPAFFQVRGNRLQLLRLVGKFGRFDAVAWYERWISNRTRRALGAELRHCRLVVVRDPESADEVARCGVPDVVVGADTAIRQTADLVPVNIPEGAVGVCFSAQRTICDRRGLLIWLQRVCQRVPVVFIPMNPQTDYQLMRQLRNDLPCPDRTILSRCQEPKSVQALVSRCSAVVSSRLHLLILAANVNTPVVGISRGSKVDNFLRNFDLKPVGSVESCDFSVLDAELQRITADGGQAFRTRSAEVHRQLLQRLDSAAGKLRAVLDGLRK